MQNFVDVFCLKNRQLQFSEIMKPTTEFFIVINPEFLRCHTLLTRNGSA